MCTSASSFECCYINFVKELCVTFSNSKSFVIVLVLWKDSSGRFKIICSYGKEVVKLRRGLDVGDVLLSEPNKLQKIK